MKNVIDNDRDEIHGVAKWYCPHCELEYEEHYENGKRHGWYYKNGALKYVKYKKHSKTTRGAYNGRFIRKK